MLIVLSEEKFDDFVALLDDPPGDLTKLKALLAQKSPFTMEEDCA